MRGQQTCPQNIYFRDLTKVRRGQQRERLKTIGLMSKLNNNSARASHFFVHSFAVPAQLRGEVTKF